MYNPLYNLVDGAVDRPLKTSRFLGSYFLDVTFPIKGLTFRSNLGIDARTQQDYEFIRQQLRKDNLVVHMLKVL